MTKGKELSSFFVTGEGPDGSGKTTQFNILRSWLDDLGVNYISAREPGGTIIGEKVREIILNPLHSEMDPRTEFLLYTAARAQNVFQVVRPALRSGKMVLMDRFYDSSTAYQGYGRMLDVEDVIEITNFATDNLVPDVTIYLDIDPQLGLARRRSNSADEWNRLDAEAMEFHNRVREGYLSIARSEKDRFRVIDGSKSINEVAYDIRTVLEPELRVRGYIK